MKTTLDPSRHVDRRLRFRLHASRSGIDCLDQHDYEFYTRYREQVIEQVNRSPADKLGDFATSRMSTRPPSMEFSKQNASP